MTADTPPVEPGHVMPIREFERIKQQIKPQPKRNAMNTIESRVKSVIAFQFGLLDTDIKSSSNIVKDLGADSLDEIELVMAIEDEFEISISDVDAEKIETVQQAIDYVTAHVGK